MILDDVTKNLSLAEMLQQIQKGNRSTEDRLLQEYSVIERVTLMVNSRVKNNADRADLVNEIICAFILKIRQGQYNWVKSPIGSYLWGIARNKINEHFRQQQRRLFELLDEPVYHPVIEKRLEMREIGQKFKSILKKLDEKYQKVILLRYYEQFSVDEIAEQLTLTNGQVYNRIHYALRLMKMMY